MCQPTAEAQKRYLKADHAIIVPLAVKEILDEQIARNLA
jgi:hypothetical protein